MRLYLAFILLTSLSAAGQTLPDSIVIIRNTYVNNFTDGDNLYRTDRFSVVQKGNGYTLEGDRIASAKITDLLLAIQDPSNANNSLSKYQIDTNWIKNNASEVLSYYSNKERFAWNEKQKEFIYKELTHLENYRNGLKEYLSSGCCYTMHNSYKNEYVVQVYTKNRITEEIKSRKYVWGYKMPWSNQAGDTLYNYAIERALAKLIGTQERTEEPLKGNKLLGHLANRIVDNNENTLYVLSAYTYMKEIEELETDFEILSFDEVQGRGRYIWNEPATMRVRLRNKIMLDNVNLVFLASKTGKTIYSRDSLKKDYKSYIERIQSVNFVSDYLKSHPNTRLDIYYFNNKGINDYNIESVNKNPKEWKLHDDYLKSLETSQKLGVKFSFDVDKAIKTSQQVHCGCNYRFERGYLEQAIFFEIKDDAGNSSIWFLLPDGKVLLYIMDGMTALNFKRSDFNDTKEYGIIYPCGMFDKKGNRVTK
ncbi:hypothetical protein [Flavisolibacter nicotianae]|uniref:hypothetical protein n=1 Tax=Flavisolibacter nicotianae TaxID=2364882 RepID=UPI000EAE81F6|nr:hypothetical protein [Flavisolibacter nicotianae]